MPSSLHLAIVCAGIFCKRKKAEKGKPRSAFQEILSLCRISVITILRCDCIKAQLAVSICHGQNFILWTSFVAEKI